MNKVIARCDVKINDVDYLKGEEIKVDNYRQVIKLNTLGFIEPLSHKDLVLIRRELEKKEVKHEL